MLTCCGKTPAMSVEHLRTGVIVNVECLECFQWDSVCASTEDDAKKWAAERFVIVQRKAALRRRKDLRAEREKERIKALEEVAKIAVQLLRNRYKDENLKNTLVKAGYPV